MICRRLNDSGIRAFRNYVESLSSDRKKAVPTHLLTEDGTSEEIDFSIELQSILFDSRYDFGEYLIRCFEPYEMQSYYKDEGFWTWLALYYFDQLCPADGNGNRNPAKHYNYVLSSNYKHRSRHAVRTSFMLIKKYGADARFLLCNPLSKRGELTEQMTARQFFIECEGVVRAASKLYFDSAENWFKRGSASGKRKGNIRRYISYLRQIELTYDLYTITPDDLLGMLPLEFENFRTVS